MAIREGLLQLNPCEPLNVGQVADSPCQQRQPFTSCAFDDEAQNFSGICPDMVMQKVRKRFAEEANEVRCQSSQWNLMSGAVVSGKIWDYFGVFDRRGESLSDG